MEINKEIRKFLIDQSVKGMPITYEVIGHKLNLDLSLQSDRNVLSSTLGEISAFEYQNGRPLISAIVIYKQTNDHGVGFYNLCEELGIGDAKKLKKQFFGMNEIKNCKEFWTNSTNYKNYYELAVDQSIKKTRFFTKDEINFFSKWVNKVYDKSNDDHILAKNYIKDTLGTKTQYWSNQIVKSIKGLNTRNNRIWSKMGWEETDEGKVRVSKFKPYTWARLFRIGDDKYDIFFTVGVDGETKELVYKLDYFFETNSNLDENQKELINANIPEELRRKTIPLTELNNHNWVSLLELTKLFILENLEIYDKLIDVAWGSKNIEKTFSNILRSQSMPDNGISVLPTLDPSFEAVDVDYIQKAKENKELGNAGEELVKHHEINYLSNLGFNELASRVKIVDDGVGYDIISFDENKNKKYIEVKTTKDDSLTPFHYSINEKLFAEKNQDNYFIYRLYNYNYDNNTADFYKINNVNDNLLMQPTQFRVFLKGKN